MLNAKAKDYNIIIYYSPQLDLDSLRAHNSSLEGVMELKFVSFCSP